MILAPFLSIPLAVSQVSKFSAADSLFAVGDLPQAMTELESITPRNNSVYLKMAEIQKATGNLSEAIDNYERVLKQEPERILSALAYGKLLMRTGELQKADSIYGNLLHKFPQNANFQYQMGLVQEQQENDSLAQVYFNETLSLHPAHQAAIFKVAKEKLRNRDYTSAQKLCEIGLEVNPANPSLLSLLGQSLFNQRKFKEAIVPFEKLVALDHGSEFIFSKIGFSHYKIDQFPEAIKAYKVAEEIEDNNPETHLRLGKLYFRVGEFETSEKHLLRALILKKQPLDAEFLSLALTYKLSEEYGKAMDAVNNALEENPRNERAWFEKAIIADSYYEDRQTRMDLYQTYIDRYENSGNKALIKLANRRIKDLREEIHLTKAR